MKKILFSIFILHMVSNLSSAQMPTSLKFANLLSCDLFARVVTETDNEDCDEIFDEQGPNGWQDLFISNEITMNPTGTGSFDYIKIVEVRVYSTLDFIGYFDLCGTFPQTMQSNSSCSAGTIQVNYNTVTERYEIF